MTRDMTEKLTKVDRLHQRAEQFLKEAQDIRANGGTIAASKRRVLKALKSELEAAGLLKEHPEVEPARSQLYYNAAKMACALGDMDAALEHIAEALNGDPPVSIRHRLEALRQQYQYLRIHGTPATASKAGVN